MMTRRSLALGLKAFALVCVSIRGLAIDGAEAAFLRQVESGRAPAESSPSPDGRDGLVEVLGTSMTYLPSDILQMAPPDRGRIAAVATAVARREPFASPPLKPPCA